MRIAIPLAGGQLSAHFGHCEEFALLDVDPATRAVQAETRLAAPDHQPGLLPRWLAEQKVDRVIAGGMGRRAQDLFQQHGIDVTVGAPPADPQAIASDFLNNKLSLGGNLCDH